MDTADRKTLCETAAGLENVVAILCYGRSGSIFFQSLLDGHPDLIVTAGLCLHPFYAFFNDNSHLLPQQLVSKFVADFAVIFDAHDGWAWEAKKGDYANNWGFTCMGENRDESLVLNRKIFSDCLLSILSEHALSEPAVPVPRKLFVQAIHVAYQKALGRPISSNSIIVYPLHAAYPRWEVSQFAQDFPNAKYIFMIRQPIETLASLSRYMFRSGAFGELSAGSDHMNAILIGAEPHRLQGAGAKSDFINSLSSSSSQVKRWKAYARAVRLEDLHRDSRATLERVCNWIGIPWHDALLTSTFHGIKWWNSATSPQVSGFTEVTIAQKANDDVLTSFDIFRLKVLCCRKHVLWNYKIPQWYSSWFAKLMVLPLLLVPFKMELMNFSASLSRQQVAPWTKLSLIARALLVGRRRLFTAWLGILSSGIPEAELLN